MVPLVRATPWTPPARLFLCWLTDQSGSGRCNAIQIWLSGFQLQLRPRSGAVCFPNQAWHRAEPAQVGLGCVPRTRSEEGTVGRQRVGLSTELAQVQQGSLASIRCQPSWLCTKSCFRASANKPSWSSEHRVEASELAEAQFGST